MIGFIK